MPWIRIDENAMDHPKIGGLSDGAFRLWVEGLAYCQKFLTDGRIVAVALRGLRAYSAKRAAVLLDSGLWKTAEDGVLVHDYLEWNDSKARVLQARQGAKERMAKLRGSSRELRDPLHSTVQKKILVSTNQLTGKDASAETETGSAPTTDPTRGAFEPRARDESPTVLTFPIVGTQGQDWPLTRRQVETWQGSYPALDVVGEARKALAWVTAHPNRRKTARGMAGFLVSWLNRATDRSPGVSQPSTKTAGNFAAAQRFIARGQS